MISLADTHCLNTARGGFHHIPAHLPCHITLPPPDVVDAGLEAEVKAKNERIQTHFEDMVELWATKTEDMALPIHPTAVRHAVEGGSIVRTWNGEPVRLIVAKDITFEEAQGRHPEVDYQGRLAGPGPALNHLERGAANGEPILDRSDRIRVFGPYTNVWSVTLVHRRVGLAVILVWRHIMIVDPFVLLCESAKVSRIVVDGLLERVSECAGAAEFLAGDSTLALEMERELESKWKKKPWKELFPPNWVAWIGRVLISKLAHGKFALVVLARDPGRVKYDRAIELLLLRLQPMATELWQITSQVGVEFVQANGRPTTLAHFQAMRKEVLCRADSILTELETARDDLKVKQEWLGRRRAAGAARRQDATVEEGDQAAADAMRAVLSERMTTIRLAAYEAHEKAAGKPARRSASSSSTTFSQSTWNSRTAVWTSLAATPSVLVMLVMTRRGGRGS